MICLSKITSWSATVILLTALSLTAPASGETSAKDLREAIAATEWKSSGPGEWLSPIRTPALPFDELIYSWQIQVPKDQGFRLFLRVGFGGEDYSPWLYGGYWGDVKLQEGKREEPKFEFGEVALDQLLLTKEALSYQFKAVSDGKAPLAVLPALNVIVTDNPESSKQPERASQDRYPVLDLPFRMQRDSKGEYIADRCQSAALATALQYFGKEVPLEELLPMTYDPEYEFPGIWPRTLGAAGQLGFTVYIDRFRNWEDVRKTVAENKVILCSIRMPKNPGNYVAPPYESITGHIVALNGITEDGRVVVTDSALAKDLRGYRCQWLQSDFEKIWMDTKGGVGMVICPPDGAEMKVIEDLPSFPRTTSKPSASGE